MSTKPNPPPDRFEQLRLDHAVFQTLWNNYGINCSDGEVYGTLNSAMGAAAAGYDDDKRLIWATLAQDVTRGRIRSAEEAIDRLCKMLGNDEYNRLHNTDGWFRRRIQYIQSWFSDKKCPLRQVVLLAATHEARYAAAACWHLAVLNRSEWLRIVMVLRLSERELPAVQSIYKIMVGCGGQK